MLPRFRRFLDRAKLTQDELAQAIGYHPTAVSKVLNGKRGASARFADAFLSFCQAEARRKRIPKSVVPTLRDLAKISPPPQKQ